MTEHFVYAANAQCYALGKQQANGFHVRRVVWGSTMAKAEKRAGEDIKTARLLVTPKASKSKPAWTDRP